MNQVCPREEKDPQIYDFINYTGSLPADIYTFFLKEHLEEGQWKRPIFDSGSDTITLQNLDNLIDQTQDTTHLNK